MMVSKYMAVGERGRQGFLCTEAYLKRKSNEEQTEECEWLDSHRGPW